MKRFTDIAVVTVLLLGFVAAPLAAVGLRCKEIINAGAIAAARGESVVAARASKMNEVIARDGARSPSGVISIPGWPPQMIEKLSALDRWYVAELAKLEAEYVAQQDAILEAH